MSKTSQGKGAVTVSIAEAILWGEQHGAGIVYFGGSLFQSQRRFFGGSNSVLPLHYGGQIAVSIAEAILWGEQH